jgi:predicted HAD superfamily Cof-like phosphohydrolase
MSLQYIRDYYQVPATIGGHVVADGKAATGRATSARFSRAVPDRATVNPQTQVTEFHRAFGCAINSHWTVDLAELRSRLIAEECAEVESALQDGNREGIARELADLAYVVIGTAVTFGMKITRLKVLAGTDFESLRAECATLCDLISVGNWTSIAAGVSRTVQAIYMVALAQGINLNAAINAVHIANMSKLGSDGRPILREDGKVLKGPNYRPPDMGEAVHSGSLAV